MVDIGAYALEYVMIVKYLLDGEAEKPIIKGNTLIVDKDRLVKLLDKNCFDTSDSKLCIWKGLKWIVCEGRYLTKRVYIAENKDYKRMVNIDLSIYEILKDRVLMPSGSGK
jgi:hypothetical protein